MFFSNHSMVSDSGGSYRATVTLMLDSDVFPAESVQATVMV